MSPALLLGLIFAAAVIFVILEARRQHRKMGTKPTGTPLMRMGMLELQSMLEPEKKIEMLIEQKAPTVQEESGAPVVPDQFQPPEK